MFHINCFKIFETVYFKVQSKVSLKYDSWHKEVLTKFGSFLGNEMTEFHATISKVCKRKKDQLFFKSISFIKWWEIY